MQLKQPPADISNQQIVSTHDPNLDQFGTPFKIAVAPDGMIYVTDLGGTRADGSTAPPQVVKVDPATGLETIVAQGGSISVPRGVVFQPDPSTDEPSLLVTDSGTNRLIRIDLTNSDLATNQTIVSSGDLMSKPRDVQIVPPLVPFDPLPFYLVDTGAQAVYRIDVDLEGALGALDARLEGKDADLVALDERLRALESEIADATLREVRRRILDAPPVWITALKMAGWKCSITSSLVRR